MSEQIDRKPIFDAVRLMLSRGFSDPEIEQLDYAIDVALGIQAERGPMRTSPAGIELIHEFESYAVALVDGSCQAYPDPGTGGKPWTIGWGSTTDENGRPISPGTVWSRERADNRFALHLREFEGHVLAALGGAPVTQGQFDAMVSFQYNSGAIAHSTLMRRHLAGDYEGAANEFGRWVYAGGRRLRGLVRRREAEAALYRS